MPECRASLRARKNNANYHLGQLSHPMSEDDRLELKNKLDKYLNMKNISNTLKAQVNAIYQIAFNNGLVLCGVEKNGEPQFMGSSKQTDNFKDVCFSLISRKPVKFSNLSIERQNNIKAYRKAQAIKLSLNI